MIRKSLLITMLVSATAVLGPALTANISLVDNSAGATRQPEQGTDQCISGKRQSPIDIISATPQDIPHIRFRYHQPNITLLNKGETAEVNLNGAIEATVDGKLTGYALQEFHFHWPSEHKFNHRQFEMEMHLVHKDAHGKLAVVGILIETGRHNAAFDPVWRLVSSSKAGELVQSIGRIDLVGMLPKNQSYYQYDGSLTTPPCTEGVRWFVMRTPIQLSAQQIRAYKRTFTHPNSREPQPLNGRVVYCKAPC